MVLAPLLFRESRFFLVEAAGQIFFHGVNALFYPWFGRVTADVLRKRGGLKAQAEHYTRRALKVLGFQILLVVSTIALGVDGPRTYWRVFNAETFSITRAVRAENRVARDANNGPRRRLTFGWVYLIAIFDVCAVNSRAATKLRLTCLQAAALVSTGLLMLSGLACYVVIGQKSPPRRPAFIVIYTMAFCWFACLVFVGRLVVVARRAPVASTSVKPVDALGSLDLP